PPHFTTHKHPHPQKQHHQKCPQSFAHSFGGGKFLDHNGRFDRGRFYESRGRNFLHLGLIVAFGILCWVRHENLLLVRYSITTPSKKSIDSTTQSAKRRRNGLSIRSID